MGHLADIFDNAALRRNAGQKERDTHARRARLQDGSFFTQHPVAVCVGCGVLAAALVMVYVAQVNAQAREARAEMLARYGGEQVEVCVATKDISAGEVVDSTMVATRVWVADLLPDGALRVLSDVVGRKATSAILAGEVMLEGRFRDAGGTFEVPYGMTAVSVPAREVQAVGGAIEPGMRIDIYATGNSATMLIGSNVLVLATNRQPGGVNDAVSGSGQSVQWITVALAPERVEETVAAAQGLSLYFTLPGEGVGDGIDEGSGIADAAGDANVADAAGGVDAAGDADAAVGVDGEALGAAAAAAEAEVAQ